MARACARVATATPAILGAILCGLAVAWAADAARLEPPGNRFLSDPAALLRAALDASAQGDREKAEKLLVSVIDLHPIIADHARRLQILLLFEGGLTAEDGEAAQAELATLAALQAHPDSPLRARFFRLLGDARVALGNEESARAAFKFALDQSNDSGRRAELLAEIAASQERSGDLASATETLVLLWSAYALTDAGEAAGERLTRLESDSGKSVRSASNRYRRAEQLYRERSNEQALAAYDRALKQGLPVSEQDRALSQRAHTLFRLRRYPEAVDAFTGLSRDAEAPLWRARSLARTGLVVLAIREFEGIAARDRGKLGLRATYLAALLLEGRGQDELAGSYFQRVANSRAAGSLSESARWRLGWTAYREGGFETAIGFFDELGALQTEPIDALRARYWRARSLERLGRTNAGEEFAAIAREFPFSYYGWRARARVDGELAPAEPHEISPGTVNLTPRELARPRILLAAGLVPEAIEEMRLARHRARGLADRMELAQLFSEGGEHHEAQRLVVDAYAETLARGPQQTLEELWWHAWPPAFEELVGEATQAPDSVAPELVLSVMREESGYRPQVVSATGARGLLQIMTETGERLARAAGRPNFTADDLFVPRTNIQLGSLYLGQLRQRFRGRLSPSIASYNAGPQAVINWAGWDGSRDDDEWVEMIPYDQTRSYVKRVLRSLHVYRVLY